jgi:hypothetical protein
MVRARGSYPRRRQFDSVHRHQISPRESEHFQMILQLKGFSGGVFLACRGKSSEFFMPRRAPVAFMHQAIYPVTWDRAEVLFGGPF